MSQNNTKYCPVLKKIVKTDKNIYERKKDFNLCYEKIGKCLGNCNGCTLM